MADADTEEQDPSIEEILDSIRQIISDDDEDAPEEDAAIEEVSEPEPEPVEEAAPEEEDIIDLVEPAPEPEPAAEEPAPEPVSEPDPAPEPDAFDIAMEDTEEPAPVAPPPPPEPVAPPAPPEESILTQAAQSAALEGFTELVRKTAVEHSGITLEEIVRTELRPLLKGWLDDNLPSIIERLVQEELERLSKRALED